MQENKHLQLASHVKSLLLQEIQNGKYRKALRLPPETKLAEELDVSRTAIRDALSAMEQEGYISRRRGTGTIINRHVVNVPVRFDNEEEFLKIVEKSGYRPDIRFLFYSVVPADEKTAKYLHISPGGEVLSVGRVITADGIPAIYCVDYIPTYLIPDDGYTEDELKKPIFDFLSNFCGADGSMDLTLLQAENASGEIAEKLEIKAGDAVMNFNETWYDFDGNPIMFSNEYYRQGLIELTILRKRQEKY